MTVPPNLNGLGDNRFRLRMPPPGPGVGLTQREHTELGMWANNLPLSLLGWEPDLFFYDAFDNGTNTSWTTYATHHDLLGRSLDFPTRMIVTVMINGGFPHTANESAHAVNDEAGNNITGPGGSYYVGVTHPAGTWASWSLMGHKDYNPGERPGFRLTYLVNNHNHYVRAMSRVEFKRLPPT